MKLYFAPRTCSLSPHIIAREAGLQIDLIRVDIRTEPHRTASGVDYADVNPKGYVPALELDDGQLLTEGVAIAQYLADLAPESGLAPPAGTLQRYRLQEWLTFVSSELQAIIARSIWVLSHFGLRFGPPWIPRASISCLSYSG